MHLPFLFEPESHGREKDDETKVLVMNALKIENIKPGEIHAYENNAKIHPEYQVQQIVASIQKFGFNNPILIDENNEIIAGHGRLMAANILKLETVPQDGGIVKSGWLHYYNQVPKIWCIIISWDTAAKAGSANAYSACSIFGICDGDKPGKYNRKIILLEVRRMKLEFPALVNFIERFPEEIRDKYRQYFTNDCVQV